MTSRTSPAPDARKWRRLRGGYMRDDGAWFLLRGAPMHGGGTAWLIHRRVTEDQVGRDARVAYDKSNGSVLWAITSDGYADAADADHDGPLYAHDHDAGALAEAKAVTVAVEQRREDR